MQQKKLVTSCVLSRLNNCNSLLMGTSNAVIQPMQEVQNAAARLILRAPRHQHCTSLLQQLHWLPISEQIKYKTACMRYNSITGFAPSYLFELLQLNSPSRSLRSSSATSTFKLRRFNRNNFWLSLFLLFRSSHLEQPPAIRQTLCYSPFLQKQSQDMSLL